MKNDYQASSGLDMII